MSTRHYVFMLSVMVLACMPVAEARSSRALLIEARNLAYDANYRNDQHGLQSAIAILEPLTKDPQYGAYAHYYLSWTYWALSASQVEEKNVAGAVDSGQRAAEHARHGLQERSEDPEFHTALANALIVVAVLDRTQLPKVSKEISNARQKALELGPRNPRTVLMDAGIIFNAPAERGGGQKKGLARWEEALRLFEAESELSSIDPIEPRWGHALAYGWMAILHLRMTPPLREEARRSAETALAMRPDFWYVRERVMPQLNE